HAILHFSPHFNRIRETPMSFADLARRTFRRAVSSRPVSTRNRAKLAVTLLEDRTVPATIEGTVFYDTNANSTQDSGEGFAEGVEVTLTPAGGTAVNTTTNADGHYAFTGLTPGSYTVSATPPSGYSAETIGSPAVGIVSDTDDFSVGFGLTGGGAGSSSGSGPPPTVSISESDTTEGEIAGSSGYFRFTRSGSTTNDLAVNFADTFTGTATSATDFTALSGSVTIPSGQTFADADVTALADNLVEGNETIIATISSNSAYIVGTPSTATLNIADDPPIVSISGVGNTTEGGDPGYVTFSRTGGDINSALPVTYTVGGTATSGTDYTALSGTVTFPAGSNTVNENVSALRDNLVEGDETVILTISGDGTTYLTSDPTTATVTIADDPAIISVSRVNDGKEGSTDGHFQITRTGGDSTQALTVTYTVAGTAIAGTDYATLSGTATIPANATSVTVTIDCSDFTAATVTKTVTLSLDTASNYVLGEASDTLFIQAKVSTSEYYWTGADGQSWMD